MAITTKQKFLVVLLLVVFTAFVFATNFRIKPSQDRPIPDTFGCNYYYGRSTIG